MSIYHKFPPSMPLKDRVHVIIPRQKYNYFKGWTSDQLNASSIDTSMKPIQPITPELLTDKIKKNEIHRNKKLAYCVDFATKDDSPAWATNFYSELTANNIKFVTEAKVVAATLWIHQNMTASVPSNYHHHSLNTTSNENDRIMKQSMSTENA